MNDHNESSNADFRARDERFRRVLERFECLQCGHCCTGDGVVEVTREEALAISAFLKIPLKVFARNYAKKKGRGFVLRDQPGPRCACIFLSEGNLCRVHAVKPRQCREFPHEWHDREMLNECEGIREAWKAVLREELGAADE